MNALWSGALALVGVCVGGGISFLANQVAERQKWQRVRESRWDERRLAAYTEYALSVKQYFYVAKQVAGYLAHEPVAHQISPEVDLPQLDVAEQERAARFEVLILLGDSATIDAARTWHRSLWKLVRILKGIENGGADAWRAGASVATNARNRFYEHARLSLAVNSGP